ncbi:MAG: hypothetical protein LBD73_07135 [Deferribacteraceae bacterium]|nr:hypothetical protein [Deferribacteraceae bacterium]
MGDKSGFLFISFAYEFSLRNSVSFAEQLVQHLTVNGADLSNTVIRTDNGSEFVGSWKPKRIAYLPKKLKAVQ